MFFGSDFPFGGDFRHGGGGPSKPVDNSKYYKLLGINRDATQQEIKRAWRKVAKKLHPDRGGDEEKFKIAQQAYEVLSDESMRSMYDQYGEEAVERGKDGGGGPGGLFSFARFRDDPRGRSKQNSQLQAPKIHREIRVSLEDVYQGSTVPLDIEYRTAKECTTCDGCDGRGVKMETVRQGNMIMQTQRDCQLCGGEGKTFTNEETKKKTIEVLLPKGTQKGDTVICEGEGHRLPNHQKGDVYVKVIVKKHPQFERIGADLALEKPVTLLEALTSTTIKVKHLSGTTLIVKRDPNCVIRPKAIIVIKEWGMPQKRSHRVKGNLHLKFLVKFPKNDSLSKTQKAKLAKILSALKYPPSEPRQTLGIGTKIRIKNVENHGQLNGQEGIINDKKNNRWFIKLEKKSISIPIDGDHLEFVSDPDQEPIAKSKEQMEEDMINETIEAESSISRIEDVQPTPAHVEGKEADIEGDDRHSGQQGVECRSQ